MSSHNNSGSTQQSRNMSQPNQPSLIHTTNQSSQIAFFRASAASLSLFSRSLSASLRFLSFSLITRSYSLSSSVRFGALTPNAPAISRPATAVVFSGRLSRFLAPLAEAPPVLALLLPRLRLLDKLPNWWSNGTGDAGVGGGGDGGVSSDVAVERGWRLSLGEVEDFLEVLLAGSPASSVSVSEPESSSSQESATGFDFGFCAGFWGTFVESWRWERVEAISGEC